MLSGSDRGRRHTAGAVAHGGQEVAVSDVVILWRDRTHTSSPGPRPMPPRCWSSSRRSIVSRLLAPPPAAICPAATSLGGSNRASRSVCASPSPIDISAMAASAGSLSRDDGLPRDWCYVPNQQRQGDRDRHHGCATATETPPPSTTFPRQSPHPSTEQARCLPVSHHPGALNGRASTASRRSSMVTCIARVSRMDDVSMEERRRSRRGRGAAGPGAPRAASAAGGPVSHMAPRPAR